MRDAARVMEVLAAGPMEHRELDRDLAEAAKALVESGEVTVDPDRWPDEYVPGNPYIYRLKGDERPWPGWSRWNV
jgi:hypothetical protein